MSQICIFYFFFCSKQTVCFGTFGQNHGVLIVPEKVPKSPKNRPLINVLFDDILLFLCKKLPKMYIWGFWGSPRPRGSVPPATPPDPETLAPDTPPPRRPTLADQTPRARNPQKAPNVTFGQLFAQK
jgi:hypothetical protein